MFRLCGVDIYCDNFDNVVPPLPSGKPDWVRAKREWKILVEILSSLGIPLHEHVPPTLVWGTEGPDGALIDHHLGWGGCTSPSLKVWVPKKRRAKLKSLVLAWASAKSFSCSEIASMVGVFMFLESTLRYLGNFVGKLISFQTKCERKVREGGVTSRKVRIFKHPSLARVLLGVLRFLEAREWSVPLFDFHSEEVVLAADAAAPKVHGLAYAGGVWGKAAFSPSEKVVFMSKHNSEVIDTAKRIAALSSPYLELENYVSSILSLVSLFPKIRRIRLIGDCETALDWINVCFPKETNAAELLSVLVSAQVELGFTITTEHRPRNDETIKIADALSRGDVKCLQELLENGYALAQYKHSLS